MAKLNDIHAIQEFKGKYFFLSNFYPSTISYGGIIYGNNEAAFQAQKCSTVKQKIHFCELKPSRAKRDGRRVRIANINEWNNKRTEIMHDIVYQKFLQNPDLKEKLLATKNDVLIEGNTWGDKFWGMVNGVGENHLGKILMDVREQLLNKTK